jgi:hypothetical protein
MLSVNCQVLRTQQIQKVNILFRAVLTVMRLIPRLNLSSLAVVVCQFLSLYPTMALLIMDLLIMDPRINLIISIRRLSHRSAAVWATAWLDKVLIAPYRRTMHLLICLTGPCCIKACLRASHTEYRTWFKSCHKGRTCRTCKMCRKAGKLETISPTMVTLLHYPQNRQQESKFCNDRFVIIRKWRMVAFRRS